MLGKSKTGMTVLLALSLSGCALLAPNKVSTAASGNPIKIGVVGSFSGTSAGSGEAAFNAVRMAIKRINDAGGVLGRQLEAERADDKSDKTAVAAAANELINKGVVALIGPNSSSAAVEAIAGASKAGQIALISPSATSPIFSDPKQVDDGGTFFRTAPSDALQGKVLARKAAALGYKKLAVVYVDSPYGVGFKDQLKAEFEATAGATIVSVLPYAETDQPANSYADIMTKALAGTPDAVVLIAYAGEASVMVNDWQLSGLRSDLQFLFGDGLNDSAFVNNVRDTARIEGRLGISPFANPAFHTAYQALYKQDASYEADTAYDATMLIAYAIAEAKEATKQGVMTHLRTVSGPAGMIIGPEDTTKGLAELKAGGKINYEGYSGPVDLDAVGDVVTGKYQIWKVTNGRIEATGEVISP